MTLSVIRAFAPGRVNLIGDHTDYAGGLALPMAIGLGTRVEGRRGGSSIRVASSLANGATALALPIADPATIEPPWARYVAGVLVELDAAGVTVDGFDGLVRSDLPPGAGLSSSAALEVALALALGFEGPPRRLAELTQRAEQAASGVPCGIMDQLCSACGVAGHALLMDFAAGSVDPVPLPEDVDVVVLHSGEPRSLAGSAYAERRAACETAAALVGPLGAATVASLDAIEDPVVRRRARHVVDECRRVRDMVDVLSSGDLPAAGALLGESHASLRDQFEVSTPGLDALVDELTGAPGVHGARLTGAGFGGCVVALADAGAVTVSDRNLVALPTGREARGWIVHPAAGAHLL